MSGRAYGSGVLSQNGGTEKKPNAQGGFVCDPHVSSEVSKAKKIWQLKTIQERGGVLNGLLKVGSKIEPEKKT